jgi:hypothetical protein
VTSGSSPHTSGTLGITLGLWSILGQLLYFHRGVTSIPAGFVFLVYFVGGAGVILSVMALRDRTTDTIVALGLRAGIIAIPLMLVLFAGFNM